MRLLIFSLSVGTWCPAPASCQSPPASAPTPEIGGVRDPGVINRQLTSSPDIVVHPPPAIVLGGVLPPTRECAVEIEQALAQQAPVPTSDPRCAEEMTKALTLQQQDQSEHPPVPN